MTTGGKFTILGYTRPVTFACWKTTNWANANKVPLWLPPREMRIVDTLMRQQSIRIIPILFQFEDKTELVCNRCYIQGYELVDAIKRQKKVLAIVDFRIFQHERTIDGTRYVC